MVTFAMLCQLLLLTACSQEKSVTTKVDTEKKAKVNHNQTYEVTNETYTMDHVKITYPKVVNLPDRKKQETINNIIKTEALKVQKLYPNSEPGLNLEINYKLKLKSAKLLSIQYSGIGMVQDAAHPNNLFYTTNLTIDKGTRLRLTDIVNVNEGFVEKFKKESKALNPELHEVLDRFSNEDLMNLFKNADSLDNIGTVNQSDTFSYLTKNSLGLSMSVSHAEGDYAIFEIGDQDLAENIKAER